MKTKRVPKMRYFFIILISSWLMACSPEPMIAPDLATVDSRGQSIELADLRGQWVVLNYWAAWCRPCIVEMPELDALHRTYSDVVVLGINFDDWEDEKLNSFADDLSVTFPLVRAQDFATLGVEPITGLPTTYFIDPEGFLRGPLLGPQTESELVDYMGITFVS